MILIKWTDVRKATLYSANWVNDTEWTKPNKAMKWANEDCVANQSC